MENTQKINMWEREQRVLPHGTGNVEETALKHCQWHVSWRHWTVFFPVHPVLCMWMDTIVFREWLEVC